MEKLVYLLWKKPDGDTAHPWQHDVAHQCRTLGARHIRINVVDNDVAPAAPLRITAHRPPCDAMLSLWLNSASLRHSIENILNDHCERFCGYLVSESEPLINSRFPAADGQRTTGMNQVVLLQIPPRLSRAEWSDLWLNQHTSVAIATQDTFGYRQNVVVHALTPDALPIDAIIEENFPAAAMTSHEAFYKASSEAELLARQQEMFDSCKRFIDFDRIDRLPMSEYNYH